MRKPEPTAFFAIPHQDGFERAMHGPIERIKNRYPKARQITADEAAKLAQEMRARAPKPQILSPVESTAQPIDAASRAELDELKSGMAALASKVQDQGAFIDGLVTDAQKLIGEGQ